MDLLLHATSNAQLTSSITRRVTISVRATFSVSTWASDTNMTYVSEKWKGFMYCSVTWAEQGFLNCIYQVEQSHRSDQVEVTAKGISNIVFISDSASKVDARNLSLRLFWHIVHETTTFKTLFY